MKDTVSEPMGIPVIFRNDKLPKLKNQLSKKKLMTSLERALWKVILNLFLSSVYVAPKFVTIIKCFSPPLKQKLITPIMTSINF